MRSDDDTRRLGGQSSRTGMRLPVFITRALAFVATLVVIGVAFMASVLVFAVAVVAGLIGWGYLWWKTRDLRKRMREQSSPHRGDVIEGEVVREVHERDERW